MTNTGPEQLWECMRLALSVAVALGLGVLASSDSARADHIFCSVSPAASYTVMEGGSVMLSANSSGCTSISWDLDNDGQYDDGSGSTRTFAAGERDGPGSQIVGVEGIRFIPNDPDEDDVANAQTTVNIVNVAPTATGIDAPASVTEGRAFSISLADATDPSLADRNVGFTYAFDCSDGTGYGAFTTTNSRSCTAGIESGQITVKGKLSDKDGGVSIEYAKNVTITDDATAPTVLDNSSSLEPDRGATGVSRTTNVSATFSEEMLANSLKDPSTNTSTTFKLQQYNKKTRKWKTIPATITLTNNNTTATLNPFGATETVGTDDPLAASKKFRGLITTGAKDLAGNPLANKFVWTFKTGTT